ncbi:MAG: FHA domain-containing protein, partial [Thermoanaerobaculum sp.]
MQRTGRPWAWALRRVRGEGPELLPLSGPAVVLGTAPDCDAVLSAKGVSRHHARLTVAEEGVRVEDLGSKNGTYCHGQRLEGAQLLVAGEEVAFGPAVYVLELVPAGETRVALPLGWPGTDGLPDGDTDSGDEGKVPTKYLELLGEVVPLLGAAL